VKYFSAFLLLLILSFNAEVYAQLSGTKLIREIQYSEEGGNITILQHEDIMKIIDKHLHEESKLKGIIGYRIRIYSNSGKQARIDGPKIQAGFISKHEGVRTYYIFDSPFYRLYVGDFRTRSEAMKFLKEIELEYPDAFIIRTRINYPAL
jgi:hypothetical protein